MSARDWLEIGWHASLLLLGLGSVLSFLLRHLWIRLILVGVIAIGLVYHVLVVQDCQAYLAGHSSGYLCRW